MVDDADNSRSRRRVAGPPPPRGAPPPRVSRSGAPPPPRGPPPDGLAPGKSPIDRKGSGPHNDPAAQDDEDQNLSAVQRWRMKRLDSSGSNNGMEGSGSSGRRDSNPSADDKSYSNPNGDRRDSGNMSATKDLNDQHYYTSRSRDVRDGPGSTWRGEERRRSSGRRAERDLRDDEGYGGRGGGGRSSQDEDGSGDYMASSSSSRGPSSHARRGSRDRGYNMGSSRPGGRDTYRDGQDGPVDDFDSPYMTARSSLRHHGDADATQRDADVGMTAEDDREARERRRWREEEAAGSRGGDDPHRTSRGAVDYRASPLKKSHSSSEQGEPRGGGARREEDQGEVDRSRHASDGTLPKDKDGVPSEEKAGSDEKPAKAPGKKKKKKSKGDVMEDKATSAAQQQLQQRALQPRVFDTERIPILLKELLTFVTNPFEREMGVVLRCFIERSRGLMNALSPVYTLYSDNENGSGRMLLAARKVVKSKTPYYVFSTNTDDLTRPRSDRSSQYLGKLRGNSNNTEYILYDDGEAPADAMADEDDEDDDDSQRSHREDGKFDRSRLRRELAVIYYNYGLSEENARKVEVVIPKVIKNEEKPSELLVEMWQPTSEKRSMAESFRRIRFQGAQNVLEGGRLTIMHQKETRYDPLSSCLVDFKGRATAASVKNFQLIKSCPEDKEQRDIYYSPAGEGRDEVYNPEAPTPILLQMGRVGRDCFNMDLQHPLSILQAFAICISRFDTKSKWS